MGMNTIYEFMIIGDNPCADGKEQTYRVNYSDNSVWNECPEAQIIFQKVQASGTRQDKAVTSSRSDQI